MQCRNCGTEIADKALICFRCGQATAEPRVSPDRLPVRGSLVPSVLAVLALLGAALFMGRAVSGEIPRIVAWIVIALATVAIVWNRFGRR